MSAEKKQYFMKLNPPRSTFTVDMTDEERAVMKQHVAYWAPYVNDGTIIVLGPVMDPKGGYGIAVASVDSEDRLLELIAKDPANGLNRYEYYPMRAVTRKP